MVFRCAGYTSSLFKVLPRAGDSHDPIVDAHGEREHAFLRPLLNPIETARRIYMHWICTPGKGIVSVDGSSKLFFGTPRTKIRQAFGFDPGTNVGRSDREDQYGKSLERPAHWIRLGFSPEDTLKEIEVLSGKVDIEGVVFDAFNGDLKPVLAELEAKGYVFTKTDYGYTDFAHLIDIGESGANGAEHPDRTAWVYLSTSFEHLKG